MKLEIVFKVDLDSSDIEIIREFIEDNLGVEIVEINEGVENGK